MASSVIESGTRWRSYVASAYLRRIKPDTVDYSPYRGERIYRRYEYTIEAVGIIISAVTFLAGDG